MSDSPKPTLGMPPSAALSQTKGVPPEAEIGQRIRALRTGLGISVETLSKLTEKYDYDTPNGTVKGVSIPTLYRYERNDRQPGAREIRLLCHALRTTPNWIVLGNDTDSKAAKDTKIANLARQLFSLIGEDNFVCSANAWPDIEHSLKLTEAKLEADDPSALVKNVKIRTDQ